jgi:hypothetical protein
VTKITSDRDRKGGTTGGASNRGCRNSCVRVSAALPQVLAKKEGWLQASPASLNALRIAAAVAWTA